MKVSRTFHISILLSVMFALFACCASADILNYASEKSNALIVIGEKATAEDVIGSLGLATGMYSEPLQTSPIAALVESGAIKLPDGYDKTVSVLGDVVAIDTATDRLEAVERLGNVRPVLTEDDTRSLASGTLTTQQGTTQYNQYLRFETTTNPASADYVASGFVSLRQDDDDQVNIFLLFEEDTRIFEYELEFQEGLSTEIDCVGSSTACTAADERRLTDLESLKFNMLGTEFMILEARATTDDDSITLHLIGDGIEALFEEGETQIFNIGGKEYEITPLIISDSTNTVKFRINGKTTKEYSPGDIDKTIDDLYIGVSEILPNEAGETAGGDLVKILLGKKSIEFKDTNYTDDSVYENIQINDDTITGTEVKIKATLQSSD
ncbi:MAG: hypothetical protein KJ574_04015, partial [Nanoarchaeota archaeon]|nr:hypothetical protein [Nanoarchaeota archaeon]